MAATTVCLKRRS